jgi:hypothetical protein
VRAASIGASLAMVGSGVTVPFGDENEPRRMGYVVAKGG